MALLHLSDAGSSQADLFSTNRDNAPLMAVMDRINGIWGRGTLRSAAEGTAKDWKMKREKMSPAYTTHWDQIPAVRS